MTYYKQTPEGHAPFTLEEVQVRDSQIAEALAAPEVVAPAAPTKEQLMAELAALTAKIQALE
jgi:hypothetical protein